MFSRYTCAEVIHLGGTISYEIIDLDGNVLAEITDFKQVENLLIHLNRFVMETDPSVH